MVKEKERVVGANASVGMMIVFRTYVSGHITVRYRMWGNVPCPGRVTGHTALHNYSHAVNVHILGRISRGMSFKNTHSNHQQIPVRVV